VPKPARKVVPITIGRSVSEEVADVAYQYWLARHFRDGSPELDLLRAMIEVTSTGRWDDAPPAPRLFLVPKAGVTKGCGNLANQRPKVATLVRNRK